MTAGIVKLVRFISCFFSPRQDRQNAERAHEEKMASATLSAQERQRELAVLLEQTEAQNQQRGQCCVWVRAQPAVSSDF